MLRRTLIILLALVFQLIFAGCSDSKPEAAPEIVHFGVDHRMKFELDSRFSWEFTGDPHGIAVHAWHKKLKKAPHKHGLTIVGANLWDGESDRSEMFANIAEENPIRTTKSGIRYFVRTGEDEEFNYKYAQFIGIVHDRDIQVIASIENGLDLDGRKLEEMKECALRIVDSFKFVDSK